MAFESPRSTAMRKIADPIIDYAVKKHSPKFVGTPTNMEKFDFHFKEREFPKFEKSNITTINPIG